MREMAFCSVIISLLLSGCVSPEQFIIGDQIDPPPGWVDFCQRNQSDPSCSLMQ